MFAGRYAAKLLLMVLISYGILSSQVVWLTPEHAHAGGPEHCCGICHAGHLPLVEPVAAIRILVPSRIDWFRSSEECPGQLDALVVLSHSRAPPSLVL
jgi:hypothetical protein